MSVSVSATPLHRLRCIHFSSTISTIQLCKTPRLSTNSIALTRKRKSRKASVKVRNQKGIKREADQKGVLVRGIGGSAEEQDKRNLVLESESRHESGSKSESMKLKRSQGKDRKGKVTCQVCGKSADLAQQCWWSQSGNPTRSRGHFQAQGQNSRQVRNISEAPED